MTVPVQDHLLKAMANYALNPPKRDGFIPAERGHPGLWAQETAANNNKTPNLRVGRTESLNWLGARWVTPVCPRNLNTPAAARGLGALWGHGHTRCPPSSQSFPAPGEV